MLDAATLEKASQHLARAQRVLGDAQRVVDAADKAQGVAARGARTLRFVTFAALGAVALGVFLVARSSRQ